MTQEQNAGNGDHQDPSEQYETGTQSETSDQPDPGEPVDAAPVTQEPNPAPTRTDTIHGKDYTVTAEEGYRRVPDAPAEASSDSDDES